MLRADDVICATSTTGTGTLTLAACPGPPGGTDFDKWLKATGFNFVSGNAVLVSYTITEYTDATFTTEKQREKGVGTLTLGASITAATLARTTVQSIVTGLNTSTPAPTFAAPTAITIGTAANTLVYVGASAADMLAFPPYVDATSGTGWAGPLQVAGASGGNDADGVFSSSLTDTYHQFIWTTPMLVKRIGLDTRTAYAGAAPVSNAYARIYAVGSDGRPGKLLYDFGLMGSAGASLNSGNASIQSLAAGSGFLLLPGVYFLNLIASYSGGTGIPTAWGLVSSTVLPSVMGVDTALVSFGCPGAMFASATGGTAGAAPDPANLTGYAVHYGGSRSVGFRLKGS